MVVVLIAASLFSGFLVYSTRYEIIEGAWGYRLPARCELFQIEYPLQPFETMVIDCPHTDLVRIWPLPIVYPWFEDRWDEYKLDSLIG